jgi:hypothetical protein
MGKKWFELEFEIPYKTIIFFTLIQVFQTSKVIQSRIALLYLKKKQIRFFISLQIYKELG